jgi:hypothetical protein
MTKLAREREEREDAIEELEEDEQVDRRGMLRWQLDAGRPVVLGLNGCYDDTR